MKGVGREINMIKRMWFQRVGGLMFAVAMLVPLSIFADSGPGWRTGEQVTVEARRVQWDLEGTVVSVHSSGDRFALRTSRGTVQIEAKGGIKVRDGNRTLRVRDLRRGERVGVDLRHRNDRRLHAREVFLIADRGTRNDRYRDERLLTRVGGEVVTLSAPGDVLVIRQYRGGNVRVDARPLQRRYGRDWARSLRRGQRVTLYGQFTRGGIFLAESLDERAWGDRHSRR